MSGGRGICCRHPPGTKHCQPSPACHKNATALYAREVKNEWDTRDKTYWRDRWCMAMKVMPYRIRQNYTVDWEDRPKGETPLPTYIEQAARGKMRLKDGRVQEQIKSVHSTYEVGRASALAIACWVISRGQARIIRERGPIHTP